MTSSEEIAPNSSVIPGLVPGIQAQHVPERVALDAETVPAMTPGSWQVLVTPEFPMPVRLRKLIGLVLILIWIFVYALFYVALGGHILPNAHWAVKLAYYAIGGLAWILPIMPLIRWMQRPDPET